MSFISSIAIAYVCSCSIRKLHPTLKCNAIGCLPARKGHLIVQKQRCGDCFSNSSRQGWHCIIWEALCSFLANFQTPTGSPAFRTSSYSHFPPGSTMGRTWSASICKFNFKQPDAAFWHPGMLLLMNSSRWNVRCSQEGGCELLVEKGSCWEMNGICI